MYSIHKYTILHNWGDFMYKRVALIDMDSYFSSIECAKNPTLITKPIAVIGHSERTVITSINYVAKSYGIKTGMNLKEAKKLCPKIIFIKADFPYYEFTTLKIVSLIEKYFPIWKEASIDEFYIPLDCVDNPLERLKDLKNEIYERLLLKFTIGIGSNPIIAKIACEFAKPDGFFEVNDIISFSKQISIYLIPGIGKRNFEVLSNFGVQTLWDFLYRSDLPTDFDFLKYNILKDYTEPEFFRFVPPKSIGHNFTLDRSIQNIDELLEIGKYLLFSLYSKLLRYKMGTKSLAVYFKNISGTFSISKSLGIYSNDFVLLSNVTEKLFKIIYTNRKINKIGLSLGNLKIIDGFQNSLFWNNEIARLEKISQLYEKLGSVTLGGFFILKQKKKVPHL